MSDKLRIVERLEDDQWIVVRMESLRKGDIFRMFEDSEEPIGMWRATSDARLIDDVWGVDVDV